MSHRKIFIVHVADYRLSCAEVHIFPDSQVAQIGGADALFVLNVTDPEIFVPLLAHPKHVS